MISIQKTNVHHCICIVVTYVIVFLWKQYTTFSMGLLACATGFFSHSSNICISPAWLCNLCHKTKKPQRTTAQGNCLSKNAQLFPHGHFYYYPIHGVHLDKLSEYALTEVKPHLSGKPRAFPKSLKTIGVQIIFRYSWSPRDRSKTRELWRNKGIFMILQEAYVCP